MSTWDERIERFWADADDAHPDRTRQRMRALISERGDQDPDAIFEWASVQDFLGAEDEAIPAYRRALAAGLAEPRRGQAIIQLASSLRTVGDPATAIDLLSEYPADGELSAPARAFLALALHDDGRADEAFQVALIALAGELPRYGRSVEAYARELTADGDLSGPRLTRRKAPAGSTRPRS